MAVLAAPACTVSEEGTGGWNAAGVPIDQYDLVDRFGRATETGVGAVFVGAGLSVPAGLPGWDAVLAGLIEEENLPAQVRDLTLLAEYYEQTVPGGRARLEHHLLTQLAEVSEPTQGHRLVAALPVREVWTSNYDPLSERAMPEAHVAVTEEDLREVGTGRKSVIKMHGSIDPGPPPRWAAPPVITRGDYERYETARPRTWALLRASYLTRTFLFLGFSFTDPNIDVLLRLARLSGTAAGDRHLTVLRRPQDPADLRLHQLRVHDLETSGIQVCEIDDFAELVPLLQALVRRCAPPRVFVSGSGDQDALGIWCERIGDDIARHEDWELASLAGSAGWGTTRRVARMRRAARSYRPERLLLYFRPQEGQSAPELDERAGTAVYSDLEREPLAQFALETCRAQLVLGGGRRTLEEVAWARQRGLGIVPVAASGGAARAAWESFTEPPLLGGRPVQEQDWAQLATEDVGLAVAAAMRLLEQAMYRSDQPAPTR